MINFAEVEKTVRELKAQLARGDIDEKTLEKRLLDMIDMADDGYYWMFGHESERWYRHDGEKWLPDDPGEKYVSLTEIEVANPSLKGTLQSIDWGWFITSLIVILVIGGIIYMSAQ